AQSDFVGRGAATAHIALCRNRRALARLPPHNREMSRPHFCPIYTDSKFLSCSSQASTIRDV
ncbi:MAG: hypothetical protein ACI4U2_07040, partial [Christensenellaceae bacterium]